VYFNFQPGDLSIGLTYFSFHSAPERIQAVSQGREIPADIPPRARSGLLHGQSVQLRLQILYMKILGF